MGSFSKTDVDAILKKIEEKRSGKRPSSILGTIGRPKRDHYKRSGTTVSFSMEDPGPREVPCVIDINPIGAPRQSKKDAWDPSPAVARYRKWKDDFRPQCVEQGWTLGPVLRAEFEIAMPVSWSKRKREAMRGRPHQQKPDIDNICKAVMDAFGEDDCYVYGMEVTKRWADKGRITLR